MSVEISATLAGEVAEIAATESATSQWTETALSVAFTASAVLFISFIAVMTALA